MKKFKIITMTLGLMLLFTLGSVASSEDVNVTLSDPKADVMDYYKALQGIYSGGDFNEDIDIKTMSYEKSEGSTKVSFDLEVFGEIKDSGNLDFGDMSNVDTESEEGLLDYYSKLTEATILYAVSFETNEKVYAYTYINENSSLSISNKSDIKDIDLSNMDMGNLPTGETQWDLPYQKNGGKLSSSFNINDENEEIKNVSVQTMYFRLNLDLSNLAKYNDPEYEDSLDEIYEVYQDQYPNEEMYFATFSTDPTNPQPDEETKITASVYGGNEPYSYQWKFDDEETTDWLDDPSINHIFEKQGTYNVNLTVKDSKGNLSYAELPVFVGTENLDEANRTNDANIDKNKNDNDNFLAAATSGNTGLIAFIALVAIILVAGLAVLYYISKR